MVAVLLVPLNTTAPPSPDKLRLIVEGTTVPPFILKAVAVLDRVNVDAPEDVAVPLSKIREARV